MNISTKVLNRAEQDLTDEPRLFSPGNTLPFLLVTALFLFWGIPSNMNDILIKQFMKSFEITRFKAGLIQSAFYMGYFLLSMPAALIMRKYSYKTGPSHRAVSVQHRNISFLAGGDGPEYGFFLLRTFCYCQRGGVPGDRSEPVHRGIGRPEDFGAALEFLPGLQSARSGDRGPGGNGFHILGNRTEAGQIAGHENGRGIRCLSAAGNDARGDAVSRHRDRDFHLGAADSAQRSFQKLPTRCKSGAERAKGRFLDLFKYRHFVLGCPGSVFLRWRPGGNLELLHPVHTGLHPSTGKGGGLFPDRDVGGFRRRKVFRHLLDEVHFAAAS